MTRDNEKVSELPGTTVELGDIVVEDVVEPVPELDRTEELVTVAHGTVDDGCVQTAAAIDLACTCSASLCCATAFDGCRV